LRDGLCISIQAIDHSLVMIDVHAIVARDRPHRHDAVRVSDVRPEQDVAISNVAWMRRNAGHLQR
jgi:hypothetical protein